MKTPYSVFFPSALTFAHLARAAAAIFAFASALIFLRFLVGFSSESAVAPAVPLIIAHRAF